MRPMEVEGRDYFFVDRSKFEDWIHDDMLLEHANVYGDYKGIPRQQVRLLLGVLVTPGYVFSGCGSGGAARHELCSRLSAVVR